MLQQPESVLSECKNAVSGEHLVGFRLNRQEPDGGFVSFFFFFLNIDTQLGVQQDRVRPAPTVFRPLTSMLVPQAEKPVASFMKRF